MLSHDFKLNRFIVFLFISAVAVGIILGISTTVATPLVFFIILVVAITAVFQVLKRPEFAIIVILVLTASVFSTEANIGISVGFGTIYLTDILLMGSLSLIVVRSLVEPRFNLVRTPLDVPLLLFVGIALLSTFIAITFASRVTLNKSLHEMRVVSNYLIFFAVTNLIRNDKQIRFLVRGLFVIAAIVSIMMIYQYAIGTALPIFSGLGSVARVETLKSDGVVFSDVTRIIPPGYSIVFVVFVMLSAILLLSESSARNRILSILWVLSGIGVALTFKRHLWVVLVLAFLYISYFALRKNLQRLTFRVLVIFFFALVSLFFLINFTGVAGPKLINASFDRLTSVVNPESYTNPYTSFSWRKFENEFAFPQIASHPFLGLGLGTEYRPFVPSQDGGRGLLHWVHNGHVWIILKTGFLGYLPFMWLMLLFLFRGFKYWRLIPDEQKRGYFLGFTLAFSGMLIGSTIAPMIMVWQWTALIGVGMGLNEVILKNASV